MSVSRGLLALLEAKPGKGDELAAFLEQGRALAAAEQEHRHLVRLPGQRHHLRHLRHLRGPRTGRQAHLGGAIPEALGQVGPDLLARDPDIRPVDVIAVK